MLKLIILKSHPEMYILGKVTEMDQEPSLLIEDVYLVKGGNGSGIKIDLVEYPKHVSDRFIFLTSTDVLTILEPAPAVIEAYNERIAAK